MERAYEYVVALRAVTTDDYMTANLAELDFSFLHGVAMYRKFYSENCSCCLRYNKQTAGNYRGGEISLY